MEAGALRSAPPSATADPATVAGAAPAHASWSLLHRLTIAVAAAVAVAWFIGLAAVYRIGQRESDALFDRNLVEASHLMLALGQHELEEIARLGTDVLDDDAEGIGLNVRYQVWTPQGRLVYRSHDASEHPLLPAVAVGGLGTARIDGADYRTYMAWDSGHRLQIQSAEPLALRERFDLRSSAVFVAAGFASLLLLLLVLRWIVYRAIRAVAASAGQIGARSPDELRPVANSALPRELAPLIDALNDLLGRVRRARDIEQRFVADAAHELRTPLAALRVQAQVAQRAAASSDSSRAVDLLLTGVDRASDLVEQLLAQSRADAQTHVAGTPTEVALHRVVVEECARLAPLGARHGVHINCRCDPVTVVGNERLLDSLVRNLIDNAVRHAVAVVNVRLTRGVGGCELRVDDDGPGIPAEQRARVFERFHRLPGTHGNGSGLGLSIVKTVVEWHRGTVAITDATADPQRPGAAFVVYLPASRTAVDKQLQKD